MTKDVDARNVGHSVIEQCRNENNITLKAGPKRRLYDTVEKFNLTKDHLLISSTRRQ